MFAKAWWYTIAATSQTSEVIVRARYRLLLLLLVPLASGLLSIACAGSSDEDEPSDLANIPTATLPNPLPDVILVEGEEPQVAGTSYPVEPGDTLAAIAERFGTTVDEITQANGITDPTQLVVGQVLVIPAGAAPEEKALAGTAELPPTSAPAVTAEPAQTPQPSDGQDGQTYTVQSGDNASDIADSFAVTLEELAAANSTTIDGLRSLEVGDVLVIPTSAP